MKVSLKKEKQRLNIITDCGQHPPTKCGASTEKKSSSKKPAWNRLSLQKLKQRAENLNVLNLEIFPETVKRAEKAGYFLVNTKCSVCGIERWKDLRNLEKGFSKKCQCQNAGKIYSNTETARILGTRYEAMMQRCYRDTHCTSHRYKGRGIKVMFASRKAFIEWAMQQYGESPENYKNMDFDRIDNNGDYSPDNLRLVTRTINLCNKEGTGVVHVGHARLFLEKYPHISYTESTILGRLKSGWSWEKLVAYHDASPRAVGRRKNS